MSKTNSTLCIGPSQCIGSIQSCPKHNKTRALRRWRKAKIVGKLTTMTSKVASQPSKVTQAVTKQVSKMASRVGIRIKRVLQNHYLITILN